MNKYPKSVGRQSLVVSRKNKKDRRDGIIDRNDIISDHQRRPTTDDRRILVTGGAGYIGSHTIHYLISQGVKPESIIVLDNLVYGHRKLLPSEIKFIEGDLLDRKKIDQIFKNNQIEAVFHFAAYNIVSDSMKDPGKYFYNVTGTVNLLEAMVRGDCKKLIFSSTAAIYGFPKKMPIDEDTEILPTNPYGESKFQAEKILEWYSKIYGIKSIRLRYFNAAGADFGIGELHDPETHLIPLVLKTILGGGKQISVFGRDYPTADGTCIRDYIHVSDLAKAHYLALGKLSEKNFQSDYYNLGTGRGISVQEIIDLCQKVSGQKIGIKYTNRRPGDPPILVSSSKKAERELDWQAEHNIEDIIKSAFLWHQKCSR
jgi:UDP-glucose 4-epimerase